MTVVTRHVEPSTITRVHVWRLGYLGSPTSALSHWYNYCTIAICTLAAYVDDGERLNVKLVFSWALSHVMYSMKKN